MELGCQVRFGCFGPVYLLVKMMMKNFASKSNLPLLQFGIDVGKGINVGRGKFSKEN